MADKKPLSNFPLGLRKFIFAMVVFLVGTGTCIFMKFTGEIWKDFALGVAGLYLASQAAVDWKTKTETPENTTTRTLTP